MKLPKSLTTVTIFSKLLALCMFIFFPIGGFLLGIEYQKTISPEVSHIDQSGFLPLQTPNNEDLTPSKAAQIQPIQTGKMCTMEAKRCPDGSYVGRTGPNCEFTACPVKK